VALLAALGGRVYAGASGAPAQEPRASVRDVAVVAGKVERLDPFAHRDTADARGPAAHGLREGLKAFDQLGRATR
jgi:hypothetical protein